MHPLVSVLIPAYNAAPYLADTLHSALGQSWPNLEVIVVDDGSTDDTLAIANSFASGKCKVVSQSNAGAAAARNTAASLAQGSYIQWLDADDLLSRNKISAQLNDAERSPTILMSCGWGEFSYRPHAAQFKPSPLWRSMKPCDWLIQKWCSNHHMQTATWLVSRELTEAAGPWNETLLGDDDGEYFTRVLLASDGVAFNADAQVLYRIVGTNRLSYIGRSSAKIHAQFHSMKLQIGYLLNHEDSARTRNASIRYLQTWLIHFHPEYPEIVNEAMMLAKSLGGFLEYPTLPDKYEWAVQLFGLSRAKQIRSYYNARKIATCRSLDRVLSFLQGSRH